MLNSKFSAQFFNRSGVIVSTGFLGVQERMGWKIAVPTKREEFLINVLLSIMIEVDFPVRQEFLSY